MWSVFISKFLRICLLLDRIFLSLSAVRLSSCSFMCLQASRGLSSCKLIDWPFGLFFFYYRNFLHLSTSYCYFLLSMSFLRRSASLAISLNSLTITSLLQNIWFSFRYRIEVALLHSSVTERVPSSFLTGTYVAMTDYVEYLVEDPFAGSFFVFLESIDVKRQGFFLNASRQLFKQWFLETPRTGLQAWSIPNFSRQKFKLLVPIGQHKSPV